MLFPLLLSLTLGLVPRAEASPGRIRICVPKNELFRPGGQMTAPDLKSHGSPRPGGWRVVWSKGELEVSAENSQIFELEPGRQLVRIYRGSRPYQAIRWNSAGKKKDRFCLKLGNYGYPEIVERHWDYCECAQAKLVR